MANLTKWSVADYHQMREKGILNNRRCELINGEIWDMAPEGQFHRFINNRGVKYLRQKLNGKAEVFEAHPITLSNSEPEPDIAIVKLPDTAYLSHHPYPEDIYWLIEIADSTLNYDLETKQKIYAQAGIKEYWVIDVQGKQIIVLRNPQGDEFLHRQEMKEGVINPMAFPEVVIEVSKLIEIPSV